MRVRSELDWRTVARDPGNVLDREGVSVEPQDLWSTPSVQPGELIFLSEADVSRLALTDLEILAAVEDGLRAQGLGAAKLEPRVHLEPDPAFRGHFNVLRGYVAPLELAGVKVVGDYLDNHALGLPSELGLLTLYDVLTGMPVAILSASQLTDMRTGALTALGARHLARPQARVLGHVGARGTAYWNVRLLDHLFDFAEIRVHSRRAESREAFARRLETDLGKPVRVTESWEECLRGADVMVEASRLESPQPLLRTRWVEPGALVIPYGTMSAVELTLTDAMDKVVVDDWGQCRAGKFGALRAHVDQGRLTERTLHGELAQIVVGERPGRESDSERILFWHRGLATSDIALGHALVEKARSLGIGTTLELELEG
jgi:alanine dehydrogenase